MPTNVLKGVVHGKTIELEQESGLPDGAQVQVALSLESLRAPGEGLRRAFGAWAGEDEQRLDDFLAQLRRERENDPRPDLGV